MIANVGCQIKDMIESDVNSMLIDSRSLEVADNLHLLKKDAIMIRDKFEMFKEDTICEINKAMGKMASLMHRQIQAKLKLQEELVTVKKSNQSMKDEVIQLREMIQDFVKSYNQQIELKDKQIQQLKKQLGEPSQNQQSRTNETQPILQVIQEVSEGTSEMPSVKSSIPNMMIEDEEEGSVKTSERPPSSEKKKMKIFLDGFRKSIESCFNNEKQNIKENTENCMKIQSGTISPLVLGDTDKINLPKTTESPKKLRFLKKNSGRMKTEGEEKQNLNYQSEKSGQRGKKRTFSFSSFGSESKTPKSPVQNSRSKEKIKLTSKIMDENVYQPFKKNKKIRTSVHLGGKCHMKKMAKELKSALQEFKVWEGLRHREVKYEGEKRNGQRWGKGKLLYENGFIYEGSFVQNFRHGIGTMSLNGIVLYEGQWSLDQINGQGYIKSMKNFSQSCSRLLSQSSYCGQFMSNQLNGMGTLFLNQNEKFVTKFMQGIPVGQYTYYNHSDIQFGAWL